MTNRQGKANQTSARKRTASQPEALNNKTPATTRNNLRGGERLFGKRATPVRKFNSFTALTTSQGRQLIKGER